MKDITSVGSDSIGERTQTIIDHIVCNDTSKVGKSGVIPFRLSDQYLIFYPGKGANYIFSTYNTVNIRSMKNYNVETFCNLLDDCDWSPVLDTDCDETAWSNFRSILTRIIDNVAPRKLSVSNNEQSLG